MMLLVDQRPIEISSIDAETIEKEVVAFFRQGYAGIEPRHYWTWAENQQHGLSTGSKIYGALPTENLPPSQPHVMHALAHVYLRTGYALL